jgi:hypothetical protein
MEMGRSVGGGLWRGGGVGSTTRRWHDFWRERVGEDDVMFVNMHGNSTEIHIVPYVGLSFSE